MSEFKVGDEYVVREGALYHPSGVPTPVAEHYMVKAGDVVRVRADEDGSTIDSDGDVRVQDLGGNLWIWVHPDYLKPVGEEPKSELDEAIDGLTKMAEGAGIDVRRIAAARLATDTLRGAVLFGGPSADSIVKLATFLLGDEA